MFVNAPEEMEEKYFDLQRRVVAHKTTDGWQSAPHAVVVIELDMTEVFGLVKSLRQSADYANARITLNSVLLKIVAEGIKESPDMNAHIEYSLVTGVGKLNVFREINIAVPFRAPDGRMISPVLKNVGERTLLEVCQGMDEIKQRVEKTDVHFLLREAALADTWERLRRLQLSVVRRLYPNFIGKGRLPGIDRKAFNAYRKIPASERIMPEDLVSATTLVSNLGSAMQHFNGWVSMLELIPPQVTAIGLGAARKRPVVVTGPDGADEIAIRQMLPLTLCFDHRAMDFEHIKGFIDKVYDLCENPQPLA